MSVKEYQHRKCEICAFVLTPAVVTTLVTLDTLFKLCNFCIAISSLVLTIFLSITLILFSRPYLSYSYCVRVANLLVHGILVSIALTMITNLLYAVILMVSLSTVLLSLLELAVSVLSLLHLIYLLSFSGLPNLIFMPI